MPLIAATLQSDFISALGTDSPTSAIPAAKIARAYTSYVSGVINAGAGTFTAMPGSAALASDLTSIFAGSSPSGAITAQKVTQAFDGCLKTLITLHQTSIITIPVTLQGALIGLFSAPNPSRQIFAQTFATAVDAYTRTCIIIGTVPGVPPIPFAGPPL